MVGFAMDGHILLYLALYLSSNSPHHCRLHPDQCPTWPSWICAYMMQLIAAQPLALGLLASQGWQSVVLATSSGLASHGCKFKVHWEAAYSCPAVSYGFTSCPATITIALSLLALGSLAAQLLALGLISFSGWASAVSAELKIYSCVFGRKMEFVLQDLVIVCSHWEKLTKRPL